MPESMITSGQLRDAADLIAQRGKWTKGFYSVDEFGEPTEPDSALACKWCAVGAVARSARLDPELAERLLYRLSPKGEGDAIADINDGRGKRAAIAELRRLADVAEALERTAAER